MSEILHLLPDDAEKYGEEAAIVLYIIRFAIKMHKGFKPEYWVNFHGIPHIEMSDSYFEGYLTHKSLASIRKILKRLKKLNVISIKEGNYYALIE